MKNKKELSLKNLFTINGFFISFSMVLILVYVLYRLGFIDVNLYWIK